MVRNFGDRSANRVRTKFRWRSQARSCRGGSKDRIRVISCQGREIDSTLILRRDLKLDPASLRRDRFAKSIGPLNHTHAITEDSLIKSDRPQGLQIFDSIKIEMIN